MSAIEIIGAMVLMIAIVFTPMFGLYYLIKSIWRLTVGGNIRANYSGINPLEVDRLLLQKFPYYKALSPENRNRFLGRMQRFMKTKEFIPAGGAELNKEMAILISAAAIQLTFGLDDYLLLTFKRIFIYPKEFYSKFNKRYHKGETNLGGAIIFSWNNFTSGYENPTNNYNLGLHEMAHALRFNKFRSDEYDTFFDMYYEKWLLVANDEFKKLSNNVPSYLREYAGANKEEFFAVCVEHFFETPHEFKSQLPEIYKHLCILLNQDPTQSFNENYRENVLTKKDFVSSVDELEQPLLETTNHFWTILLSKYTAIAIIVLLSLVMVQTEMETRNIFLIAFGSALLLFLIIAFVVGKKTFYLFSNRIKITSPLDDYLKRVSTYYFDTMVMVTFTETDSPNEIDTLTIDYIENGKIKSEAFRMLLPNIKVKNMADLLVRKKVAVKVEGFKHAAHWY